MARIKRGGAGSDVNAGPKEKFKRMKRTRFIGIGIAFIFLLLGAIVYFSNINNGPIYQGKPASFWIQQIESEDNKANLRAFIAMGPEGLPFLVRALQTEEPWSNKALKRIRENAPGWLIRKLPKPVDFETRRTGAAWILGGIGLGARSAHPALIQCAEDKSSEVRASACQALGKTCLDEFKAVQALSGRLEDPNSWVRIRAMDALGQLGMIAQSTIPKIASLLNDPEAAHGCSIALREIGAAADHQTIQALIQTLRLGVAKTNSSIETLEPRRISHNRAMAARALGVVGGKDSEAVSALLETAADEDPWVRQNVFRGLAHSNIPRRDAIRLMNLFDSENNPDVARELLKVIRSMGKDAEEAVPLLMAFIEQSADDISNRFEFSKNKSPERIQLEICWLRDHAAAAVWNITRRHQPEILRVFEECSSDGLIVQETLADMDSESLQNWSGWSKLLSSEGMMRSQILWAGLARSHFADHQEANSILNSALSSDDPITRFYRAYASHLATDDADSWLPEMKAALSDAFASKSVAVPVQYLARMGGEAGAALPELNKLLWHPDHDTRLYAALAIRKISSNQ